MSLNDLADYSPGARGLFSWMLLRDNQYQEDLKKGLPFFSEEELTAIERKEEYMKGLPFKEISKLLSQKGMILKPPTFKKYISLNLIPSSVGRSSKGKSSIGLYPANVIREINFIKYALYANLDLSTVINRFKTSFFEMIQSSFSSNISYIDFGPTCGNLNEAGEGPSEAIKRIARELREKGAITEKEATQIIEAVDLVDELMVEASDKFRQLRKLLEGIPIAGEAGLRMLLFPNGDKEK